MAILEETKYIKILPEKCYVDNFVHICFVEYRTEQDRINEKLTSEDFNNFIHSIYLELDTLSENEFKDRLYNALDIIKLKRYRYDYSDTADLNLDSDVKDYLEKSGLNVDWYKNPIYRYPECTVTCDVYNNEELNLTFYYNQLKQVMNKNIIADI